MSKFIKNSKTIEIVDLSEKELVSILKININCALTFTKQGKMISYIILGERSEDNGINMINISTLLEKNSVINYDELFKLISSDLKLGTLSVKIENEAFREKEPLILLVDDLKDSLTHSCVYIDYDMKKHMFTVMNKNNKGLSDKLYYFEDNNSILAFGQEGPMFIFGKTQSVEDLICN